MEENLVLHVKQSFMSSKRNAHSTCWMQKVDALAGFDHLSQNLFRGSFTSETHIPVSNVALKEEAKLTRRR